MSALPGAAVAQSSCARVFTPSSRPQDVAEKLKALEDIYRATKNPDLLTNAQGLLAKEGIETLLDDSREFPGLIILPQGDSRISKIARGLDRRGVELRYSIAALVEKSVHASYSPWHRTITMDAASFGAKGPSPSLLHEIRHAVDADWAVQTENGFERLFQAKITTREMEREATLPGAVSKNSYTTYFSLDEILAHRQSAGIALRRLKREIDAEKHANLLRYLQQHALRFIHFSESWKATSRVFEGELSRRNLAVEPVRHASSKKYFWVSLIVDEPASLNWFQKNILRQTEGNPWQGLRMTLLFNERDTAVLHRGEKDAQKIFLKRLEKIDVLLGALEAPAREFYEATMTFKPGQSTERMENALRDLHRALAEHRRDLDRMG
ncbi:MAG: hypothetical protein KF802_00645 [Bdellovibrionaceae bacterium]|nr:hypothetical protein [Pseudobdellovibrionaceae bacterium]